MKRVVAYVDGFNLYFGLKHSGFKRYSFPIPSSSRTASCCSARPHGAEPNRKHPHA